MIAKTNTRFQVTVSKEEYKKLKDKADKDDRSVSYIAAKLIRKSLK